MSEIKVDIKLLKELRDTTGVSYSECRIALLESENNFDKALEVLKVRGLSKAMQKANNVAAEGITKILVDNNTAVIAELNCQTDFVANNLEFNNLLNQILVTILKNKPTTIAAALENKVTSEETMKELILRAISKLGENIVLKRFKIVEKQDDEIFGSYVHTGAVKSGLVVLSGTKNHELATNIAMQLVAMSPKFIDVSDIDDKVKAQELAIAQEQVKDIKKPLEIIEKMIEGKVNKALAELTISNQAFIKDSSITIKQYLAQNGAKITNMVRYEVGELI